jgi:hypothetical protein
MTKQQYKMALCEWLKTTEGQMFYAGIKLEYQVLKYITDDTYTALVKTLTKYLINEHGYNYWEIQNQLKYP